METLLTTVLSQAVFITILGWIANRYFNKMDKFIDRITESVNDLAAITKVHEHRLKDHDDEIKEIREQYLVRYKK